MTTTPSDPATLYTVVASAFQNEERIGCPIDFMTWQGAVTRRATLASYVQQLEQVAAEMRQRLDSLPRLAHPAHVQWAQAVREFPNLAFLEVDTDGLSADADILRISLVDQTGAVLYDQFVQPRRPLSDKIVRLTGITPQLLEHAPHLSE